MSANVHPIAAARLPEQFRLGEARVDLNANVIRAGGSETRITPKAAAVLRLLAARPGRAMTREELLATAWADAFPTDDVLSHAITELRRALGDDARNSRYIETIPKVGYRLLPTPEPVGPAAQESPEHGPATRWGAGALVAFLLGLGLGAAGMAAWFANRTEAPAGPARDPLANSFPVSAQPGPEFMPAVSPDGRRVAYVAAPAPGEPTDILVKTLVGEAVVNLTQSRGIFEYSPVWSPDGERVAFLRFGDEGCRVVVRPVAGGLEQDLASCIADAITYVDWSPDGNRLAMTDGDREHGVSRIHFVDVRTGRQRALDYALSGEHDVQPKFSPDGRLLLFRRGANPRSELYLVDVSGGEPRRLTDFGSRVYGFDWLPDSRRFWFCAEREGAPALYEGDLEAPGFTRVSARCAYGLSIAHGADTLAFVEHSGDANLVELALGAAAGAAAEPAVVFASTRNERDPAYSPDGRHLVFVSDRSGEDQLWLGDREAGTANQLTRLAGLSLDAPAFGADGESVVFIGRGGGQESLYRVSVRSGIVERVSGPGERVRSGALGPDGAVYLSSDRSGDWQLWRQDPRDGSLTRLTGDGAHRPVVPGDGHVYFTRLDSYGLWRVPVSGGEPAHVSDHVDFANHEAWFVREGALFVPGSQDKDAEEGGGVRILRVPLGDDAAAEVVATLQGESEAQLAGVAPGGGALLFTRVSEGQEDIVAVTGF